MTDYACQCNEQMVSWIITSTCQLLPKSATPVVCDQMHDLILSRCLVPKKYSMLCGSTAEFYIRPLNTCISDNDYLITRADELVFSGEFPVLPGDFSGLTDTIDCYKIETYERYPGFVRLKNFGKMNYNWKYKKYEFKRAALPNSYKVLTVASLATEYFFSTHVTGKLPNSVSGPAIEFKPNACSCLGTDLVQSVWCPQWPREAKDWPIRPRHYGWPTIYTISEVVQSGCHVVYVQHRSCRDDKEQWRFSFSLAEVILLQSWTQIQQIAYHLLRFFAKRELIQKNYPKVDQVLCTYHLKTLMLWTCEEMSPEWWNSSSVIVICCKLLEKLSEWLKRKCCPNYFYSEANLLYKPSSSTILDKTIRLLNQFSNPGILCHWFAENYILSFFRTNVRADITMRHFMCSMLSIFEVRNAHESRSMDMLFSSGFADSHKTCRAIIKNGCSSGLRPSLKLQYYKNNPQYDGKLTTTQKILCFTYYDNLLYILNISYGIIFAEISWDSSLFVELIKAISMQPEIIRSQYHNFPKAFPAQSNLFQFLSGQDLMKNLHGQNSRSEFQLLSLMSKELLKKALDNGSPKCRPCNCMSEEFLRKALEHDSCKSNGIAPAALAYLAAHFATSEYQETIRSCLAVLVDQTPQKEKETLNAGCLLFIDDIARIVGLCVLHKKITGNNLQYVNRRLYLDLRLSPKMLAHYLAEISAERISKQLDFYPDLPALRFPMDEYLKALVKSKGKRVAWNSARQIVYRGTDSLKEIGGSTVNSSVVKETVINILKEYALENMTSFYNVFHKDFGIQCNTIDCYRALHVYKCRHYDEALHLCDRILHEPDLQSDLKKFAFANVLVLPPLDSLFDGDVQSLVGFHTLFHYLSPLQEDFQKFELTAKSTFAHCFAHNVYAYGSQLSRVLQYDYLFKSNYFLGRHFLARYLKVRCCIDCNLPYSEAMSEFAETKCDLPFEHIIRRFLLQKLRTLKNNIRVL